MLERMLEICKVRKCLMYQYKLYDFLHSYIIYIIDLKRIYIDARITPTRPCHARIYARAGKVSYMTEKQVEQLLKRRVEKEIPGARCMKWVCPGYNGVPDRIILLPGGRVVFAELKRPGEKPRPVQLFMHDRLREIGFTVLGCVDGPNAVDEAVRICKAVAAGWLHESGGSGGGSDGADG